MAIFFPAANNLSLSIFFAQARMARVAGRLQAAEIPKETIGVRHAPFWAGNQKPLDSYSGFPHIAGIHHVARELMSTIYDWLTVAIFAGLAVVFLQRSIGERPAHDTVIKYLPPSLACMGANYVGNEGMAIPAVILMVAALVYIWFIIRPFERA